MVPKCLTTTNETLTQAIEKALRPIVPAPLSVNQMPSRSEGVLQAQAGHRLVPILENLEALLGEEVQAFLDLVLRAHTNISAATVIGSMSAQSVDTEVGISKASHGIDGKRLASGNHIVDVDVHIIGTHAVILEVIDKLGSEAPVGDRLNLNLCTKARHRIFATVGKLSTYRDVTSFGICAKSRCQSHDPEKHG